MGEKGSGRRMVLLMLDTISASLNPGCTRNFCHSGSAPKLRHRRSRAAKSSQHVAEVGQIAADERLPEKDGHHAQTPENRDFGIIKHLDFALGGFLVHRLV